MCDFVYMCFLKVNIILSLIHNFMGVVYEKFHGCADIF